jgi:hypothetical protein
MNPNQPPPEERDEVAHYDDAIIGKAFRWSAFLLLIVIAAGTAIFFIVKRKPAPVVAKQVQVTAPVAQSFAATPPAGVHFTDITEAAGIHFTHVNGAQGEKLLPETMGGGVGFFDYDNDGDQDLLFVNII